MTDILTEEGGGSPIDFNEEEQMESILRRLTCVDAGEALIGRLAGACNEERENVVLRRKTVSSVSRMEPVAVDDAQVSKWAGLMDAAARKGTEQRLERLSPAGMPEFSKMRCSVAMDLATAGGGASEIDSHDLSDVPAHGAGGTDSRKAWFSYRFYGIAATLLFALVSLPLVFQYGRDGVDPLGGRSESQGLAGNSSAELNRQAVRVVEEGVNWNDEQGGPQMQYHVDFEDSVEVTDGKGRRALISVPKSRKVVVPVQVY